MLATRNRKLAAIAVAVVALVGVGTAIAASTLHSGSSSPSATDSTGNRAKEPRSSDNGGRGFGLGRRDDGGGFGFGRPGGSLSAAATYLGVSQTQLFADLRAGKTLAQIASSTSGKSASGLIDAMVAAQRSDLESAVQSGRITRAMADQIEAAMKSRVTQLVDGGFGGGLGRGGRLGPPAQSPTPSQSQPGTSPT